MTPPRASRKSLDRCGFEGVAGCQFRAGTDANSRESRCAGSSPRAMKFFVDVHIDQKIFRAAGMSIHSE